MLVRNTTEAINVLSAALPAGTRVLSTAAEHHANMLPWRRHDLELLPFTRSPDELLAACELALRARRTDLLAVTGASNVTGEVWPVASTLIASVVLRTNTTSSSARAPTNSATVPRASSKAAVHTRDLAPLPRCTLLYHGTNASTAAHTSSITGVLAALSRFA